MAVLSVFPRRHLRACLSRLAVARGAQLRTSLLLLLALRDAARQPRRLFLRRCCDLRLLRHRLSPWQARHCAVAAPGAKQCLGLPVRDAPLPRAVRCLRGVRVVCRSCVGATPLCVINARRARERGGARHCLATEHCDPRPSGASEGRGEKHRCFGCAQSLREPANCGACERSN
ncbi:hypothetical protein ERJ75_001721800 [Trypanosoma vivax]|nr:hypothetical protein ERJ75_001721800 [Trypanosoma vivax]